MRDVAKEYTEMIAKERSQWIESIILNAIPKWKIKLLKKHNHRLLKRLLRVDLEVVCETVIAEHGVQYTVFLNGKSIANKKFLPDSILVKLL